VAFNFNYLSSGESFDSISFISISMSESISLMNYCFNSKSSAIANLFYCINQYMYKLGSETIDVLYLIN